MSNPLLHPEHPIWSVVRLVVILLCLTGVLWMNAEHFDETEIRTILTMFFALAGVEGLSKIGARK